MSNWTHVAAIFRIKCFHRKLDFETLFGKEISAWSSYSEWEEAYAHPERFLPLGSEGSLKMTVWINQSPNHLGAFTVSIFGDLRDHDSADEIIRWFDEKCSRLDVYQAAITVDNERTGIQTKDYYA